MADSVHIAGLSAHKIAGPLLIIKAEVLLQKLAVYLVSHVIECSLGRSLKDNLIEKTQDTGKQGGAIKSAKSFGSVYCNCRPG